MKEKIKRELESQTTDRATRGMIDHMYDKLEELKERTRQLRRERGLPD